MWTFALGSDREREGGMGSSECYFGLEIYSCLVVLDSRKQELDTWFRCWRNNQSFASFKGISGSMICSSKQFSEVKGSSSSISRSTVTAGIGRSTHPMITRSIFTPCCVPGRRWRFQYFAKLIWTLICFGCLRNSLLCCNPKNNQ